MKQTAVEWLVGQMLKQGYFDGDKPLTFTNLDHLQQQAKEMEKQQGYSEEEVGELVYNVIGEYAIYYGIMIDGSKLNNLFEQFKKK
jgi:hypothetical protein